MNRRAVYITGCNGFVAHRLRDYLQRIGEYNVFGITRGNNTVAGDVIYSDYRDVDWLRDIVQGNSVVVHAAAAIPSRDLAQEDVEATNVGLASFIANVFVDKQVTKLLHLSSIAIYGYGLKELIQVKEDAELVLDSPYARSKYECEKILSEAFAPAYHLRLSSPFGKGKRDMTILETIVEKICGDQEVLIYGRGERRQDFIWVEDVARIIESIIVSKRILPGSYNLSTGQSISVREVIDVVSEALHKQIRICSILKDETPSVSISNEKLLTALELGQSFFTPFDVAIREIL